MLKLSRDYSKKKSSARTAGNLETFLRSDAEHEGGHADGDTGGVTLSADWLLSSDVSLTHTHTHTPLFVVLTGRNIQLHTRHVVASATRLFSLTCTQRLTKNRKSRPLTRRSHDVYHTYDNDGHRLIWCAKTLKKQILPVENKHFIKTWIFKLKKDNVHIKSNY